MSRSFHGYPTSTKNTLHHLTCLSAHVKYFPNPIPCRHNEYDRERLKCNHCLCFPCSCLSPKGYKQHIFIIICRCIACLGNWSFCIYSLTVGLACTAYIVHKALQKQQEHCNLFLSIYLFISKHICHLSTDLFDKAGRTTMWRNTYKDDPFWKQHLVSLLVGECLGLSVELLSPHCPLHLSFFTLCNYEKQTSRYQINSYFWRPQIMKLTRNHG